METISRRFPIFTLLTELDRLGHAFSEKLVIVSSFVRGDSGHRRDTTRIIVLRYREGWHLRVRVLLLRCREERA